MALRVAAQAQAQRGLIGKRFFTGFSFTPSPSPSPSPSPPAEPSTTLFVSGLNKRTTTETLREAFSKFGEVVHARVVTDPAHGFSKGFGFVRYATLEQAAQGREGMDAQFLEGWVIFAEYARPRTPQPRHGDMGPPRY